MNSFKFLAEGMAAEIERQIGVLEGGGTVEQETLHYDPAQRSAALAALEGGGARLPLLPRARPGAAGARRRADRAAARRAARAPGRAHRPVRARLRRCPSSTRSTSTPRRRVADYFEQVAGLSGDPKAAADWVMNQPTAVAAVPAERPGGHRSSWSAAARSPRRSPSRCTGCSKQTPDADPAALVERAGPGQHRRRRRAEAHGRRGDRGQPGARRAVPRAARTAWSTPWSARS